MMRNLLAILCLALGATRAAAQAASPCTPPRAGEPTPAQVLDRARAAIGSPGAADSVLHFRGAMATLMNYQSDRSYAPFFSAYDTGETWYDPASGVERTASSTWFPGSGPMPPRTVLAAPAASFGARDTAVAPAPMQHAGIRQARLLNPWAVLRDWSAASGVASGGSCTYRDFPRRVLTRRGPFGEQRLYVDPRSGYPVALVESEPHYLWGTSRVEYVWSNWAPVGGGVYPLTAFRVVDGETEISRTVGELGMTPRGEAPRLSVPSVPEMTPRQWTEAGEALPTDTVRAGDAAFLLASRAYTEGAVLAGDTIYLLDATLGERRARADSAWLGRLFPGRHPVAVVVTDLAWPHVAGVRYWTAQGATIISHRTSEAFLRRVVDRRWTEAPDTRERRRAATPFRFRAVDDSASLGGGRVRLYAINGPSSEGALMAWVPSAGLLWAGDYVQTVSERSAYGAEVLAAARRVGIRPERVAAQHLPLTPWTALEQANPSTPRAAGP